MNVNTDYAANDSVTEIVSPVWWVIKDNVINGNSYPELIKECESQNEAEMLRDELLVNDSSVRIGKYTSEM